MPTLGSALGVLDAIHRSVAALGRQEIATLTLTLGLLCFAVLATIVLLRTRAAPTGSRTRRATTPWK